MTGEPTWTPPEYGYTFGDGLPRVLVGELYGLRSFSVTPDGWLTGVTYRKPWTPGVNEAECWHVTAWESEGMRTEREPMRTSLTHDNPNLPNWKRTYTAWEIRNDDGEKWYARTQPKPLHENRGPEHNVGTCVCGLHGYMKGSLNYGTGAGTVSAVVRAWGQMGVGSRGFRAQFARILALYIPTGTFDHGGGYTYSTDEPGTRGPDPDALNKVRDRYQLPTFTTLAELIEAFPTTSMNES